MSTQENYLMGKSQVLLSNPKSVRARKEVVGMIGIQKGRISIRARRFNSLHKEDGYMTFFFPWTPVSLRWNDGIKSKADALRGRKREG